MPKSFPFLSVFFLKKTLLPCAAARPFPLQIRFTVEYAQARTDYIDTLYGFFTTTSILSALAAFLRWQNWSFRNLRAGGSLAGGGGGTDLVGEGNGGGGGNGGGAGLPGMAAGFALTLRNRECANLQRLLRSPQWNGILIIAHSLAIFTVLLLLGLSTVFFVLFKLQSRAEPAYLLLPPATVSLIYVFIFHRFILVRAFYALVKTTFSLHRCL